MFEQDLRLTMPDGTADAVLFSPDPSTPLPGVLHLPDIGSVREAHRQMARRLAAEGYAVLDELRGLLVGQPKPEDLAPAQVAGGEDGIGKRADSAAATGRRGDEATARDVRDDFRGGI